MLLRSRRAIFLANSCMFSWEIGEQLFQNYRRERFVLKTVKLSSTFSKVSLQRFNNQPASAKHQTKLVIKSDVPAKHAKQTAGFIQMVEVPKERGKPLAHWLYVSSFYCDPTSLRCTKPDKEQLITELENNLNRSDFSFNSASDAIIDFMFKMRQYPDMTVFGNFGEAITILALTLLQR